MLEKMIDILIPVLAVSIFVIFAFCGLIALFAVIYAMINKGDDD